MVGLVDVICEQRLKYSHLFIFSKKLNVCLYLCANKTADKALFTNDVYKPYHHPMLQIMTFVDGTVQGVLQRMIVDETL